MLTAAPALACHSAQQVPGGVLYYPPPPFPGTMGCTEQHQALPPPTLPTPSVPPPLRACLLFPHPAVSVCLCACLSVPHPSSPRALPSPVPALGCPLSLCPHGGHSTGVGTPHGQPSQWGWAHLSPPNLRAMLGGPWGRCLTHTTSLASPGRGGSGALSSAAAKPPLPVVCLSFPFFAGGGLGVTACQVL